MSTIQESAKNNVGNKRPRRQGASIGSRSPTRPEAGPRPEAGTQPEADRAAIANNAVGTAWTQGPSTRTAAAGLEHLAALAVELRQGTLFEELPMWVELSCGIPRLGDHLNSFTLHTRSVEIQFIIEGGRIKPATVIPTLQQDGRHEEANSETVDQTTSLAGDLGGSVSRSGFSFGGMFKAGGQRATSTKKQAEGRPEVLLISQFGDSRIIFGDPDRGDLLKGGYLAGVYPKDRALRGDTSQPLLLIQPDEHHAARKHPLLAITVVAVVPADALDVRSARRRVRDGDRNNIIGDAKRRGDKARSEHIAHVERLREQMARRYIVDRLITLQKSLREYISDAEIIVSLETRTIISLKIKK